MNHPCCHLRLLGRFELRAADGTVVPIALARARVLIAYLALNANGRATRDSLTGLLWSERGEAQARQSLRQTLAILRAVLDKAGLPILFSDRGTVGLDLSRIEVDALRLRRAGLPDDTGEDEAGSPEPLLSGIDLRDPVADAWLTDRRQEFQQTHLRQLGDRLGEALRREDFGLVERLATATLDFEPAAESAYRALMHAALHRGERHLALRLYQKCRRALAQDLAVPPSPETEKLRHAAMAAGRPFVTKASPPGDADAPRRAEITLGPIRAGAPSLVMAPLRALDGTDRGKLLAYGLQDDIIVDLSRMSFLSVVPTGAAAGLREVGDPVALGHALNVRYVLGGNIEVREAGASLRARIAMILVDAEQGVTAWAERYDIQAADLWAIRDDVSRRIAITVSSAAEAAEWVRIQDERDVGTFGSWELCVMAKRSFLAYEKDANATARRLYSEALASTPALAQARLGIGWTHLEDYCFGWSDDPPASLSQAEAAASAGIVTARTEASSLYLGSYVQLLRKNFERAEDLSARARSANANDPEILLHHGYVVSCKGAPVRGLECVTTALSTNPRHPNWHHFIAGSVALDAERPAFSLRELTRFIDQQPGPVANLKAQALRSRAAAHALAGQREDAHRDRHLFMAAKPEFRLSQLRRTFVRNDRAAIDRYIGALADAGFPL